MSMCKRTERSRTSCKVQSLAPVRAAERNTLNKESSPPERCSSHQRAGSRVHKPLSTARARDHLKQNQASLSAAVWGVERGTGRVRVCMINSVSGRSSRVSRVGRHTGAAPYSGTPYSLPHTFGPYRGKALEVGPLYGGLSHARAHP